MAEEVNIVISHQNTVVNRSFPANYHDLRRVSSTLYSMLHHQWACLDTSHARHTAQLLLRSGRHGDSSVEFLFGYETPASYDFRSGGIMPLRATCKQPKQFENQPAVTIPPNLLPGITFAQPGNTSDTPPYFPGDDEPDEIDGENLVTTAGNCCGHLDRNNRANGDAINLPLGYVDLPKDNVRIVLKALEHDARFKCHQQPLSWALDFPLYTAVSDSDRITIALNLVQAVLKFHSTPWWRSTGCVLDLVSFFSPQSPANTTSNNEDDLASSLDTLHISTPVDYHHNQPNASPPTPPEDDEIAKWAEENHGIRNLTLYSLGVALLQIGLWDGSVSWSDHVQVRRKTARLSYLGKKYRNAARRLIECNFGQDSDDLEDEKLQRAVFTSVVGDLEALQKMVARSEATY
ncbi:hypothetical protein B0H66DRAFT_551463 [Apodospora peruviana]|uniref:Uncharacterized protein n=1 Tax=Apodospora peruviana TaxID=516989 RepID=A0AAE0MBN5_9PEZI|nr:hypothetical protein B0H66DRAFT_551463 [Apodospora peruviana]